MPGVKGTNPSDGEASLLRRSQPLRQTRTKRPRNTNSSSLHAGAGSDSVANASAVDRPIDIFPAITHFADAITALPKDVVRHFILLKEVDAKVFAPEEQLFKLVAAATEVSGQLPQPTRAEAGSGAHASASQDPSGPATSAIARPDASSIVYDPSNIPRRQLFRQTALKIQELLVSLEEKNHVISTANEALQRQLARIEDVWPHLGNEFSEEAKWGSTTHWAYPENRVGRSSLAERTRRDGAAAISAAAQVLVDEAAARSDARKQAVQAKKNMRNNNNNHNHLESDFDDHENKSNKKTLAGKGRKTAEGGSTGLGISNPSLNGNPPTKRRKVEKPVATSGGAAMERTPSAALSTIPLKAKISSPRETPVPDGAKKRKALPTASGQSKKSKNGSTMSPSVASSPGITSLPEPRIASRGSPAAQGPSSRQTTSRARQNSIQSISEVSKVRSIPTAPLSRQTSKAAATPDLGAISTPVRTGNSNKEEERNLVNDNQAAKPADDLSKSNSGESKTVYEANTIAIPEAEKKEPERPESSSAAFPGESKKEAKVEEVERKSESIPPLPTTMATVTTKSGRASKPSTPALQQFQEALGRPRSSRNNEGGGQSSKKHQKRNSTASQALAAKSIEESKKTASADDEDGDVDADELRYCYCNGVSYGGMVACDADGCEKEWFHLACVGLKVAPGSKTTWYCEDCKKRLQMGGKKVNGR